MIRKTLPQIMKRKVCSSPTRKYVADCTRSKRPKLVPGLPPVARRYFWVSATQTRNYMIRDPLVDWLKLTKKTSQYRSSSNEFYEFIMERGNEFEEKLVEYIHEHKIPVVSVSDKITDKSCRRTINLMKQGAPIIHSAPFKNGHKHIRGIIDLLVRSDRLGDLVTENPLPAPLQTHKAPNLNGKYHYVVIDVKFSTLPLRADGRHILNSGSYPAYKAQTWIYNQGIGHIQGYTSPFSFILGRRWTYTTRGERFAGLECLDKLGVIDFNGVDSDYPQRTRDAIQWLKELRRDGKKWTIDPPSREELYPNMCIDSGKWNGDKKAIARKIGDITEVWYCGTKHRQNALSLGIESWRDPECTSEAIGMGGVRGPVVDKIMDINRQDKDKLRPAKIRTEIFDWRTEDNEMFVDFETFTDIFAPFDNLPAQPKTDSLFMIGVYYRDGTQWKYKAFTTNAPTHEEEYRVMDEFVNFVRDQGNPKLWYWYAENMLWHRAENRQLDLHCDLGDVDIIEHIIDDWKLDTQWVDLCKLFREEPIVIKDCFKFGLKEVAAAMRKHGMIRSKIESECDSGMTAAVKAWKTYQNSNNPAQDPVIKDISTYNKFDVEVLHEILFYLRRNH